MSVPTLSIVMPVYNTGHLLLESVRSVVAQTLFAEEGDDYWELLIVDDASNDEATRASLEQASAISPSIRVLANQRAKGAAGARNTGVFAARGGWIRFLDSDDLLYPDFLRRQRDAFASLPLARWRAAHFDVGDEAARVVPAPLSQRSPCLYQTIADDYVAGRVAVLPRAVGVLLRCGCIQAMTVQVRRELIQSLGGFNESYVCAEDYDLWLRLANVEELAMAPIDAGIYRVRAGSLTKAGRPMYYGEDRMLLALKADRAFADFAPEIHERLRMVYTKFCFHFRERRQFAEAARFATRLIRLKPADADGWRQLLAALLRR
jgi:glycosyltransferase involved in cell wall biosynthesis